MKIEESNFRTILEIEWGVLLFNHKRDNLFSFLKKENQKSIFLDVKGNGDSNPSPNKSFENFIPVQTCLECSLSFKLFFQETTNGVPDISQLKISKKNNKIGFFTIENAILTLRVGIIYFRWLQSNTWQQCPWLLVDMYYWLTKVDTIDERWVLCKARYWISNISLYLV